jgi:hypothetical protein
MHGAELLALPADFVAGDVDTRTHVISIKYIKIDFDKNIALVRRRRFPKGLRNDDDRPSG